MPSLSCRHPSIRTLGERLMRSVHIGCSRYSRRCHLLVGLSFHRVMERGPGQGRSRWNSAFGYGSFNLSELCCQSALPRIVERFVCLATGPEIMQEDCQFPGHRNNRSFLSSFASKFGQLQPPPTHSCIFAEIVHDKGRYRQSRFLTRKVDAIGRLSSFVLRKAHQNEAHRQRVSPFSFLVVNLPCRELSRRALWESRPSKRLWGPRLLTCILMAERHSKSR